MGYCYTCKRVFANSASLRTHRSKFHRNEPEDTGTINTTKPALESEAESGKTILEQSEDDTGNEDTETDVEIGRKDVLDSETESGKSTINQTEDDTANTETNRKTKLTAKRKLAAKSKKHNAKLDTGTKKRRFNTYPPKSKEHHVFKTLSSMHNILETLFKGQIKRYNFIDSLLIKRNIFDNLIPTVFASEESMKKELNEDQFNYATVIRELKDLSDIHLVLNEAETQETLLNIVHGIKDRKW